MIAGFERLVGGVFSSTKDDRTDCERTSVKWTDPEPKKTKDFWQRMVSQADTACKSTDGSGRIYKIVELAADVLQAVEPVTEFFPGVGNFIGLLKDARGFQQPVYRIGMGFDYLANPIVRKDHWKPYESTRYICPGTLILVSCLGLAVYLDKKGVFQWETLHLKRDSMQWFTKLSGTCGAGIAASFSYMDMSWNWWAKHYYVNDEGEPMTSVESDGKAEKVHELGRNGWTALWAGNKYTAEMIACALCLTGVAKRFQKGLVWSGAVFGVVQFFQSKSDPKEGKVAPAA